MRSRRPPSPLADDGGIGLLGLGLGVCIGMLLTGGVAVSTAQTARVDVLDAADHASAAAADRIFVAGVYTSGVEATTLDQGAAAAEAARVLAATPMPAHVSSWRVSGVQVQGEQVSVAVSAVVEPPVIGSAMASLGAPMAVSVTSIADAHLQR